jgi:hypothetical protein
VRAAVAWLLGGCFLLASPAVGAETIELLPGGPNHWGGRNIFAPIGSIFMGPGHFYGERTISVRTVPEDAMLDLFYVRAGFQKRFEQTDAPVTILLPKRIDANPKDFVIIRAFAEGHRIVEQTVKVTSRVDEVVLEMTPLPNALEAVRHVYFAGRASLSFLTKEALTLRLTDRDGGFSAALTETAKSDELGDALEQMRSPLVRSVSANQLGEDLLIRVKYGAEAQDTKPELRSRSGRDAVRDLYFYDVDIIGPAANTDGIERARSTLKRIRPGDVSGCAARFDATLRKSLDTANLSRALSPSGTFVDPYLRAAMRRLGEVSPGGAVTMADGTRYDTRVPLQLAAAQADAAAAKGYLALLRRWVALLEPADQRESVLRGVLAPELEAEAFAPLIAGARNAESRCRAGG